MKDHGSERRKFPRASVELLVRYKILKSSDGQFDATTKNISAGGLCLITREQMKPGTIVAMDIKFPHSSNPVMVSGKVVWSTNSSLGASPGGHSRFDNGVEFVQITDLQRQRIMEQIESQLENEQKEGWKVGIVKNIPT